MRIVIFTNSHIGLYMFRKELIKRLCMENEVYIVLPDGRFIERLKALGCRYISCEFSLRGTDPFKDIVLLGKYIKLLKELKPDVVLTYTIKPNVYGGIACQICKVPYIANVTGLGTAMENGGVLRHLSFMLYRKGLRKASCVFFQNRENEKLFHDKRITGGNTRLIPGSGVNLETHKNEPYPDDKEGVRFLYVGRLMKDKGTQELLSAIREIKQVRSDVVLDIVGWSEEDYSDLLRMCEETGAVRFHGFHTDIHRFYKNCHCVVLPSYHEGMANAMLEASSSGRPVITTRVPGCRETFDEGITGFGCEAKDVESLKSAMMTFLQTPWEKRREMGIAARMKMEREYDRREIVDAYLEEISAAVSGKV